MRAMTIVVTSLSAVLLALFAYEFRPGTFFDAAPGGVPLWAICLSLSAALIGVAIGHARSGISTRAVGRGD